jgi:hypothetical protein
MLLDRPSLLVLAIMAVRPSCGQVRAFKRSHTLVANVKAVPPYVPAAFLTGRSLSLGLPGKA